ncbi:serine/threonine-protein kinase [Sandaracinus amylolyticus]|uniref:Serine/threonine protein kinase n=1 Tax=Sandaracinus amylolyticus TaxID=927083 RepID=A0A0F6WAE8_9BACT|nr:serine/threonine-protein kinase [Sandaracinus amylolyticus]AKF11531.1 serine/threonine protein kinase [Sandaracinus amylolyticus]
MTQEISLANAQALPSQQVSLDDIEPVTHSGRASLSRAPSLARFGRYDLLGRIAFGGMAEIFLAREVSETGRAGRHVVLKRVLPHVAEDEHFVEMFVDEARLAMHLNHPNICHVYAFGEESGSFYIAMEWVDGMPLSKLVRRARERGGVPIPIALRIVAMVAEALDYAHRASDSQGEPLGIVHRDVSPQNVMVSYDGPVKLLDFGIAKAASHSTRTEAGVVKGKFAYMSPQQCLGEPIDARADVFALGLCLYEILTGRNPFKRQTEFDTMRAIVYEDAPPLADAITSREPRIEIQRELEALIARAIAKKPEERFQSAGEMQMAIEQVLARSGTVVLAAKVGELMHDLFANEIKAGPQLDRRLSMPPPRATVPSGENEAMSSLPPGPNATQRIEVATPHDDERPSSIVPPRRRMLGALMIAAGLALFAVTGGVGAWVAYTMGAQGAHSEVVIPSVGAGPSAPAAPTTGAIYVDSTPSGAHIELEDRGDVGTTPMEIGLLSPGRYLVRLRADGHDDWERAIDLRAGDRAQLVAVLSANAPDLEEEEEEAAEPEPVARAVRPSRREREPAAPPGRVSINSRPWSKVYVGGRLLGTTPIGDVEVQSGSVRLRFVDRDGEEHVRSITVPPGGHAREFFDLRAQAE